MKLFKYFVSLCAVAAVLCADTVETKDGSKIVGTVKAINAGDITMDTAYAGTLTIKVAEIISIRTERQMNIRLADGTVARGTLDGALSGNVEIKDGQGAVVQTAAPAQFARTWELDAEDPDVVAQRRKWTFEVAADVTGKTGTSEQFGTALSARAELAGPRDLLALYANYDYQETDHDKSSDKLRVGASYQHNLSAHAFWYVRDEAGFDKVKSIDFSNVVAAGFGYKIIDKPKHLLSVRGGLSHRYEKYKDPLDDNLNDVGLDLGLDHSWTFKDSKIVTRLSYVPSLEEFHDYIIQHETYYEIPLSKSLWKFRIGVANDFTSRPAHNAERLDTTYFARLVLSWE